jgi:hypothetical protein
MAMNFSTTSHELQDDETWVLFMNAETKEQSKQWMHTDLPKKPKEFKEVVCPPER